jgi:hypothetical protein
VLSLRFLRRILRAAFRVEVWNVGVTRVDLDALVRDGRLGPVQWARLRPNPRLRADPVFWPSPDGLRILYEELPFFGGKAGIYSISVAELDLGNRARREIDRPTHLSYPLLVEEDGVTYCVPESACSGGVDLYAWDPAQGAWGTAERIIDATPVIDPTFVRRGDHWFLFGTLRGATVDTQLHIWFSPCLRGPWQKHPQAPIASVNSTARGAGPFFMVGDTLYRPSQSGHAGYGAELCINCVDVLDLHAYAETEVTRLRPNTNGPYPDGLHTLALHGDLAVIDGKRYEWHPLAAVSKLLWQLRSV